MVKVRPEQLEAFRPLAEADFVQRVAAYVGEDYSDSVVQLSTGSLTVEQIPVKMLHELIQNGITRARVYGLSWESSLSAFVTLMFVVAPNFDEHQQIHEVLSDEKTDANSRIDSLWERTSEEDWDAAKQMCDTNAWKVELPEQ